MIVYNLFLFCLMYNYIYMWIWLCYVCTLHKMDIKGCPLYMAGDGIGKILANIDALPTNPLLKAINKDDPW